MGLRLGAGWGLAARGGQGPQGACEACEGPGEEEAQKAQKAPKGADGAAGGEGSGWAQGAGGRMRGYWQGGGRRMAVLGGWVGDGRGRAKETPVDHCYCYYDAAALFTARWWRAAA